MSDASKSGGAARVAEAGPLGMVTLRGDLGDTGLQEVCRALTGAAFPARGRIEAGGEAGALAWMSPDELLLILPKPQVPEALGKIAEALSGRHHLAVDVSDARAVFDVTGPGAREVIAKLAPVDLHPAAFPPGHIRRSRLGQVAAAFWLPAEGEVRVICFRSVADYTRALLERSAADGPVGFLPAPAG